MNIECINIKSKIATIKTVDAWPSKNIIPNEIYQQFNFRKNHTFEGENSVTIVNMFEPVWWTRPLEAETETAWIKNEKDEWVCTLPFFLGTEKTWKSNYNILVNKNNLPTLIQLKFNHKLSQEEKFKLSTATFYAIIKTLINLGANEQDFCCINNDLLLRGKKFVGNEIIIENNIYTECLFINLKYAEEKELFEQIYTGKKTNIWPITGILDEYPNISKEAFLQTYCTELKKIFDEFEL